MIGTVARCIWEHSNTHNLTLATLRPCRTTSDAETNQTGDCGKLFFPGGWNKPPGTNKSDPSDVGVGSAERLVLDLKLRESSVANADASRLAVAALVVCVPVDGALL